MTNVCASTALPKVKVQTCRTQQMKPHTCISVLRARQLNPIEESWDIQDWRSPRNGFVCRRRHGLCSFTGITLRVQAHAELALRVTMFNMVRQHTKLSSETSIRRRTLASNDDFLTFHKSALMRRTLSSDFLALKSIEFNETLHVARYDKYLCIYFTFFKSNRRIKRYKTKKVKKNHKIMEPRRRQSHLRRYYSASSSHTELALRVITGGRCGLMHPHRYVQPAVNCQPSYCWGDS